MPSHFSTIGLRVRSEEEMYDLANRVGPLAEPLEAADGVYFHWADPSGAELWIQVRGDEILGLNPHFAGRSRLRARLTARVKTDSPSPLDGTFHAWADPPDGGGEDSGAYPFVFDAPDARLHDGLQLPATTTVQVAAYAREIEAFDSPEAYAASQGGEVKFAARSFIPSGLFTPGGESTDPPRAQAIFTGEVLEADRRVNQLTGESFVWCLVDTYGGVYDVVVDPELLPDPPKVGGVVSGSFWLTGRILTE